MSTAPALEETTFRWLGAALIVAALPHATHLPIWVSALVPAAILLRLALRRPPGRWLLIPLVVAAFAGILVQFRAISGPDAGGAFLTAMIALKFLEARSQRDAGLLLCLTYFLAVAIFLYSESIAMAAYVAASLLLTTVALMTVTEPRTPAPRERVAVAATLLAQAVPIMVVLFLLFPRIPGPLWHLGESEGAATGLSDSMSPGGVSDLAMSHEVAFRVEFEDDELPAPAEQYWRGPVFTDYDGETWSESEAEDWEGGTPAIDRKADPVDYTLTLEAHEQRWLFTLDVHGDDTPAGTEFDGGRQLLTDDPVGSNQRFDLRSYRDYRLEPELPDERRAEALALPDDAAPRARELATELREEAGDRDAAVVQAAVDWLEAREFEYTLTPQQLTGDPVDDFLFDTRAGFCEHFASAFTVVMRAADIPARVVTGYLGMEGAGDYQIVRQSDAHAWVEIWLPDQGWVRVDPTATVAPERIDRGIGGVSGTEDVLSDLARRDESSLYRSVALAWDGVNHAWNQFVLGYGPELQERLLERLGLEGLGRYALGVLSIGAAGLLVAALWLLGRAPDRPRDRVERMWRRVERRLARLGHHRAAYEGVDAFTRRVARERPDLAAELHELATLHDRLRYQQDPDAATQRRFETAARRFRPRPAQTAGGAASARGEGC